MASTSPAYWDPRTQAYWPIALSLSFKFIGDYLRVHSPYREPQSHSTSPLLFVPDLFWHSPRSASLADSNLDNQTNYQDSRTDYPDT